MDEWSVGLASPIKGSSIRGGPLRVDDSILSISTGKRIFPDPAFSSFSQQRPKLLQLLLLSCLSSVQLSSTIPCLEIQQNRFTQFSSFPLSEDSQRISIVLCAFFLGMIADHRNRLVPIVVVSSFQAIVVFSSVLFNFFSDQLNISLVLSGYFVFFMNLFQGVCYAVVPLVLVSVFDLCDDAHQIISALIFGAIPITLMSFSRSLFSYYYSTTFVLVVFTIISLSQICVSLILWLHSVKIPDTLLFAKESDESHCRDENWSSFFGYHPGQYFTKALALFSDPFSWLALLIGGSSFTFFNFVNQSFYSLTEDTKELVLSFQGFFVTTTFLAIILVYYFDSTDSRNYLRHQWIFQRTVISSTALIIVFVVWNVTDVFLDKECQEKTSIMLNIFLAISFGSLILLPILISHAIILIKNCTFKTESALILILSFTPITGSLDQSACPASKQIGVLFWICIMGFIPFLSIPKLSPSFCNEMRNIPRQTRVRILPHSKVAVFLVMTLVGMIFFSVYLYSITKYFVDLYSS